MINASEALIACEGLEFDTVLDIGAGDGCHSAFFRNLGKMVDQVDLKDGVDYMSTELGQYDLIWCSHVLEHQPNPNLFLRKIGSNLKLGGHFVVTVPPLKHDIVGGHVTLWNAGLLLYNLILAGFNCSKAKVKTYDYNVSVIVQYEPIILPDLRMDFGDIESLSRFFPFNAKNGFDGQIMELNW